MRQPVVPLSPRFRPRTTFEKQIFSDYENLLTNYDDDFMIVTSEPHGRYYVVHGYALTVPVPDPQERAWILREKIKKVARGEIELKGVWDQSFRVVVALDLFRPFAEQWVHPFDIITSPVVLHSCPLVPAAVVLPVCQSMEYAVESMRFSSRTVQMDMSHDEPKRSDTSDRNRINRISPGGKSP